MKNRNRILIILRIMFSMALFFLNSQFSFGQWGLTHTEIQSTAQGQILNILNPNNNTPENIYTGLYNGTVDGNTTQFYSTNVITGFLLPDTAFADAEFYRDNIQFYKFILDNYFPYKTSYPGMLSNINDECSAIQLALWYFSDSVNINTVNNTLIKNRANSIVADALCNAIHRAYPYTLEIINDIEPEFFIVKTTDENGNGISVNNIDLLLTQSDGYLSTNNVNTINGYSQRVEVVGSGVGLIFATGNCVFSQGYNFVSKNNSVHTGMFLAKPVIGRMTVTYDWGTLPVELSAFTYSINNRDLTLRWTTVSEINNSGFEVEKRELRIGTQEIWVKSGFVKGNGSSNGINSYSFTERNLSSGKYEYRLKQIDFNGNFEYFNLNSEVEIGIPAKFSLSQNYPNPFNPATIINYQLSINNFVSLKVYNALGKEVITLVNENQNAGSYSVKFIGEGLPGGVYFYTLESDNFIETKRMVLLK